MLSGLLVASALLRAGPPRMVLPADNIGGMDLQRQLGELKFSEVTSVARDAEAVLSGAAPSTNVGPQQVSVELHYGELTAMDVRGTRVLIKRYSAAANSAFSVPQLTNDADKARAALEAALAGRGGTSVAEALAQNEYASHVRVQAFAKGDVDKCGLLRLLGRQLPDPMRDRDDPAILYAHAPLPSFP